MPLAASMEFMAPRDDAVLPLGPRRPPRPPPRAVRQDAASNIRIIFPTPAEDAARSAELHEASHEQNGPVAQERLRKWIKNIARVFDYRTETLVREENRRTARWPVVGTQPVYVVNRLAQHQRGNATQQRPRRPRRQREFLQRSDSGVTVKTLPRYNAAADDTEMTLYKTETDSSESEGEVLTNVVLYDLSPFAAKPPSRRQARRGDGQEQAGRNERDEGEAWDPENLRSRRSRQRMTPAALPSESAPRYEEVFASTVASATQTCADPQPSSQPSSSLQRRSLQRSHRSAQLTETIATPLRRASRFLLDGRPNATSGQEGALNAVGSVEDRLASLQLSAGDERAAEGSGSAPPPRQSATRTLSAPVTRTTSLSSLAGRDGVPERRGSWSQAVPKTPSTRLPFQPPVSGYTAQQLAFLASIEELENQRAGAQQPVPLAPSDAACQCSTSRGNDHLPVPAFSS